MPPRIPVTILTGFLGAGKSTLLGRWLSELPREETVVIINEQGQVGIDGELLSPQASRLREITGGCICCTTILALDAALTEFAEMRPAPGRVLVETSGGASPAGVIRALTRGSARDRLRLDGVITAVDATRFDKVIKFTLAVEQLSFADVVVLTHADKLEPGQLDEVERNILKFAPAAVVVRSSHAVLPDEQTLLDLLEARGQALQVAAPGEGKSDKQLRHGIDAVAFTHEGELDEERFTAWVESELGGVEARILRLKGILAIEGVEERVIVQGVGESIEVSVGAAWGAEMRSSKMVVLGLGLDDAKLQAGFARVCIPADVPSDVSAGATAGAS